MRAPALARIVNRTVNRKATEHRMNNMKRMRGRQHRGGSGGPGGGGGGPPRHQGGGNIPLNRNHVFDSSGPDVRVRGTAQQLFEKYLQLGRDATSGGDRVMAESYFQHAEHYFRIINAMNQAVQQSQQGQGGGQQHGGQRRFGDNEPGGEQGDDLGQDERIDARQDSRQDSRSYENRSRGQDADEGQHRGQQRHEPRGEARTEPRPPGTGDQPDAREIPIAAAPPEG
jgi:hypothetical protein